MPVIISPITRVVIRLMISILTPDPSPSRPRRAQSQK
jgi:hypothetical protein